MSRSSVTWVATGLQEGSTESRWSWALARSQGRSWRVIHAESTVPKTFLLTTMPALPSTARINTSRDVAQRRNVPMLVSSAIVGSAAAAAPINRIKVEKRNWARCRICSSAWREHRVAVARPR